jgi:molybdenum cofactor cytidylyltransferase
LFTPDAGLATLAHIDFAFGTIVLAAGRSSRMGRPKLLLPWGETTILGHLLSQWHQVGSEQVVVVHGRHPELLAELDRLKFSLDQRLENPAPHRGMFSSIQCAANWDRWKHGLTHWAIVLGDQPHLRERTLAGLVEFGRAHSDEVCQPVWKGRPKHPVIMPGMVFTKLKSSACADLKEFLKTNATQSALFQADDPGLDWDIDYPADYERVRAQFGAA